jgi:prolyl-tRNA synthetase
MKGSSVQRDTLEQKDKEMIQNGKVQDVIEKYKKKILKDNDFKNLGFTFKLDKKDANQLQANISSDAEFLKGNNLTDYSLLLTIHKYTKEDAEKSYANYRVMISHDNQYIYNFSIIDYLTVSIFPFFINPILK